MLPIEIFKIPLINIRTLVREFNWRHFNLCNFISSCMNGLKSTQYDDGSHDEICTRAR